MSAAPGNLSIHCFQGGMAFAWLLTNIFLPLLPLGLAWGLQYLRNQKFDLKKTVKDEKWLRKTEQRNKWKLWASRWTDDGLASRSYR